MPNWTQNQQNAIHSTNGSILVSASAGSGKTAVLVERVISRITDKKNPTPADKMLVVTYTKAAAAEMKERIIARLYDLIKANPYDSHLRYQQLKLQNAHISTIHSFCSQLVRENFYSLGVSKDFRIADDGELSVLKNDAIDDVFDTLYSKENNSSFLNIVEAFSDNKDDKALKEVVFKLYEFLRSHPFPHTWLEEKLSYYNSDIDISTSIWAEIIFKYSYQALAYGISLVESNLELSATDEKLQSALTTALTEDKMTITGIMSAIEDRKWDDAYKLVSECSFGRFPSVRGYKDNPTKIKISENRDKYKKIIANLLKYFIYDEESCKADLDLLKPVVEEMFNTVLLFDHKFQELKKLKNILDYSDLEHYTLKLLVKEEDGKVVLTEMAHKIASQFDEVMVDEYQDANEVQDIIFKAVSNEEEDLFVVGDVKQSIYSFRQAMPKIFIDRKEKYPLYVAEKDNYPGRIVLEKNFRSRKEITDSVNFVFDSIMSKDCGDIEYNEEETLVCGATYNDTDETKVSLNLIDMDYEEETDKCIVEADFIAKEIFRIKSRRNVYDKGELRPANDGDFAILLRSANKYAHIYVNRLKMWGIQATSTVSESFLQNREIVIITNLLRIIDNPLQDIPLLSVMASPLYGFTGDELALMRTEDRKKRIYNSLVTFAENGSEKAKRLLEDLDRFRTYAVTMPVHTLLDRIFEETFYTSIFDGVSETDVPYNNILLFKEYATNYESSGYKGLSAFVTYIDNLVKQESDLNASKTGEDSDLNAVKIMSIHGSKGLEFPFVFLANTTRKFVSDSNDNVLIHKDLGFSLKAKDYENSIRYNTLPKVATSIEIKNSEKSEELRVLYVALTRAREELHMICTEKNMANYINKMGAYISDTEKISPYAVSSANKISDWLIMCGLIQTDGSELRKIADIDHFSKFKPCPKWDIKYIKGVNSEEKVQEECDTTTTQDTEVTDDYIDTIIKDRLEYKYKNDGINAIPTKVAVSDISHNISKERFKKVLARPDFMSEKSMTPTERGTAVHSALQYIDFKNARNDFDGEIERLISKGFITKRQGEVLDRNKLLNLVNSPLTDRIVNSEKVYREFKFYTKILAKDALENVPDNFSEQKIILQGAVDLAFVEDNSLVIVDYKTDRIKDVSELKELYSQQLLLYKNAMEQCTPYKVSKCIIYSITLGDFVEV